MSRPARREIEKFANTAFEVDRDRIIEKYAEKKNHELDQVRRTGNSGGYLPALTKWGAEREREMALARADAWVRAFTLFGEPSDAQAEEALKTEARLSAAGSISTIRGELQTRSVRLRIAEEGQGMPWHLEIERSLNSALKEGVLRLRQQRITSKSSEGALQRLPAGSRLGGAETAKAQSRLRRAAFVTPILTAKGWSILDWANNAEVDFHTATDYLKGTTKPYASTRKKLADALGVAVENLPA